MQCTRIEAYLTRDSEEEKVNKTLVAFGKRYHLTRVVELGGFGGIAIYHPEEGGE